MFHFLNLFYLVYSPTFYLKCLAAEVLSLRRAHFAFETKFDKLIE